MRVVRSPQAMRELAEDRRRDGRRIALVPTMGFLHEGHLSLLREARGLADIVILSIFVNPTQFGPGEDLDRYPRDEDGDLAKARACGVDFVFSPTDPASMYPPGYQTVVTVPELAGPLCGVSRPGHFAGVATIVTKLFQLTRPHVAVFGEKDFQQLAIIRRMSLDLDLGVNVRSMPIVREADGLAMSSRNRYLSKDERRRSLALSSALGLADNLVGSGERDPSAILGAVRAHIADVIDRSVSDTIDYVELLDAETLTKIERLERPAVLAMAVQIGATRLIDNRVLTP